MYVDILPSYHHLVQKFNGIFTLINNSDGESVYNMRATENHHHSTQKYFYVYDVEKYVCGFVQFCKFASIF